MLGHSHEYGPWMTIIWSPLTTSLLNYLLANCDLFYWVQFYVVSDDGMLISDKGQKNDNSKNKDIGKKHRVAISPVRWKKDENDSSKSNYFLNKKFFDRFLNF